MRILYADKPHRGGGARWWRCRRLAIELYSQACAVAACPYPYTINFLQKRLALYLYDVITKKLCYNRINYCVYVRIWTCARPGYCSCEHMGKCPCQFNNHLPKIDFRCSYSLIYILILFTFTILLCAPSNFICSTFSLINLSVSAWHVNGNIKTLN